jgi:hypothetical protein
MDTTAAALGNLTTGNGTAANGATAQLLEGLIPALLKTFLVILVGFVFGATGLYPTENAGAIGRLCGTLLLPVTVFNAMATLIVTPDAFTFLYAVLICKAGLFVLVLVGLLIFDRSKGVIGRAAIWAVFCTQSNDFALGLPIFEVLYATEPGCVRCVRVRAVYPWSRPRLPGSRTAAVNLQTWPCEPPTPRACCRRAAIITDNRSCKGATRRSLPRIIVRFAPRAKTKPSRSC